MSSQKSKSYDAFSLRVDWNCMKILQKMHDHANELHQDYIEPGLSSYQSLDQVGTNRRWEFYIFSSFFFSTFVKLLQFHDIIPLKCYSSNIIPIINAYIYSIFLFLLFFLTSLMTDILVTNNFFALRFFFLAHTYL